MSDEGREQLLKHDESIVIPEKEKGLTFDQESDTAKYDQSSIDDILKMFN